MPDQRRVHAMARLAMLDKQYAGGMKQVRENYRSDYIGKRILGRLFGYTAFFLILICLACAFNMEFLIGLLVSDQLGELGICLLIGYLVPLLFCGITGYWKAAQEYAENERRLEQAMQLLRQLGTSGKEDS